ncbi:N-acetylmuramoyl-L-alanine amidase [Qaidamihabitans albus]|uniref:N-acetylmuramoyl-L-alanine amidase n=1 Tax=Qaidamihabitans albus TaxID=2795733 RepID=UPI0027DC1D5B|nr:N-acetylmuramoyl-L-alanine amidase [Qaidamihabitans albus]
MRHRRVLLPFLAVLLVGGCGGGDAAAPVTSASSTGSTTATTAGAPRSVTVPPVPPPARTPGAPETPRQAPVVVLDAGHNGGNASHPEAVNRQVPAGRGRMKACNTTGTATAGGYPEHAFNFDVSRRVGDILTAAGVRVVPTRDADVGIGPCVDERAAIGNEANAAAVVSIHADGSTAAGARGFHIAYAAPPLNEAQGEPANRLARTLRDTFEAAGFPTANYLGEQGLSARDDLAGLNLSERPAVLVECGNMRDAGEAAAMSTPAGRQRYAEAIAAGITAYLGTSPS